MDLNNDSLKSIAAILSKLSPLEFASIGCLTGLVIAASLNSNEQNSLGNFLELVGQVVLTVQAQGSFNDPNPVSENEFNNFKNYIYNILKKK